MLQPQFVTFDHWFIFTEQTDVLGHRSHHLADSNGVGIYQPDQFVTVACCSGGAHSFVVSVLTHLDPGWAQSRGLRIWQRWKCE